jgi:hypothetical protein
MSFAVIIPTVGGPVMAGQVYDRTGSYEIAFMATAGLLAVSMFCFFFAGYWKPRRVQAGA